MSGSMRIIAGAWRSRRLLRPESTRTRPMPDRVKGAIFSILGSHYGLPGMLPPLRVADVFAGSGSMGLEALSRGADRCWFFERDREVVATLRKNCEALGAADRSETVVRDAWIAAAQPVQDGPFDLMFLDPPYDASVDSTEGGRVRRFLSALAEIPANRPLVVLHHPASVRFAPPPQGPWRVLTGRTFGSGAVTLFVR